MVADFPNLPRSQEAFTLFSAARVGGISLGGTQQVVANPASLWRARLGLRLRRVDHFLSLRGFLAGVDGQAGAFTVGPIDWRGQPWYRDPNFGTVMTPGMARRNGTAPDLDFTLDQGCEINAVTLYIRRGKGGALQVGQYLQLGDRLHTITALLSPDPPDVVGGAAPGTVGVTVRPWTKAAFGAGTPVEFAAPKSIMRLSDATTPDVEMTTTPVGDVTLNLVEA